MLKKRDAQESIFNSDNQFLDSVGRDTFYGFLAQHRHEIFRDEEFAFLYCKDNGRPSVAPSMLAVTLLLQIFDKVSDEEAALRAHWDIRWQVALGIPPSAKPFVKSTLQLFRAQMVIHEKAQEIFLKSLDFAKRLGYFKTGKKKIRLALDTTPIFGRGAVKDTYNLLADGILGLMRVLAELHGVELERWSAKRDLSRYLEASIKGSASINWDERAERETFLRSIVADADRVLLMAREERRHLKKKSREDKQVRQAAALLSQLLVQDIDRTEQGATIRKGVAKNRICSTADPDMRHGRKSSSNRFDGHKAALAVDTESQLITAVELLPGNSHDHTGAMDLVEATERNTGADVSATLGDCAYGDGATRKEFREADRALVAKAPSLPEREGKFSKDDFSVNAQLTSVTCPGKVRSTHYTKGAKSPTGEHYRIFHFPRGSCRACPLAAQCVKHPGKDARVYSAHPQELFIRAARREQKTVRFKTLYRLRQAAEHRLARLSQLGMRQARYCGRIKTRFQLLMTATVANLTLLASRMASGLFFVLILLISLDHQCTRHLRATFRAILMSIGFHSYSWNKEQVVPLTTVGCRLHF